MRLYIKLFHKNVFLFIRFSLMFSLKVSVTLIFLVYFTIIFFFFLSLFIIFFGVFKRFVCVFSFGSLWFNIRHDINRSLSETFGSLPATVQKFQLWVERCCADGARARFVENLFLARAFHFSFPKKPKCEDREEWESDFLCSYNWSRCRFLLFFRVLSLGFSREARRRTFKTINRWQVGAKYSSRR